MFSWYQKLIKKQDAFEYQITCGKWISAVRDDVIKWKHFRCDLISYPLLKYWLKLFAKHDDAIKWNHLPRYWPFVRGIHHSTGDFPAQRPVTRSFDVFFDVRQNKRLCKQSRGWWYETPSRPLWRHCNGSRYVTDHKYRFISKHKISCKEVTSHEASLGHNG